MKLTKNEEMFCQEFVKNILDNLEVQQKFYVQIANNSDRSDEFITQMTNMACCFKDVENFVEISADKIIDSLLIDVPLGDTNSLGQAEEQQHSHTEPAETTQHDTTTNTELKPIT